MKKFKLVENAREFVTNYKDGDEMAVGYCFFAEDCYESAKIWLSKLDNRDDYEVIDFGYAEDSDESNPHLVVVSHSEKDSHFVFDNIKHCVDCRLVVASSRLMERVSD